MRASQEGHVQISRLLIHAGADVNRKNNEGMNALMLASQRGHSDMALLLIKAGAGIDEKTQQGSTALMLACKRGNEKVVEVLVSMGAELYIRDSKQRCARDTAEKRRHLSLLRWLDTQVQIKKIQEYRSKQRLHQLQQLRMVYYLGKLRVNANILRAMTALTEMENSDEIAQATTARAYTMGGVLGYRDWEWPFLMLK